MNDKETKVPIYIAIIVALALVAAAGYYVTADSSTITPPPDTTKPTQAPTPKETQADSAPPSAAPTTAPVKADVIKCELCHTNPQDLKLHIDGGKLCINCHGSQVHNIHIGSGTVGLSCDLCHGFPPKIPTVQKGEGPGSYSVCEQCHAAPPDSLKPSDGNLVVVHLSRAKYCTNCHGTNVGDIHMAALSNASKK
ncbi:hypothetical protein ANME2D_00431 [Candidatus Methanoperedens nitroreducens]|uniref:Uncharacterized protein n=1 Tax=Candidatus Methanoperedens nitratireducens TaxID=1392998 RepID=A0A062VDS9_9EURY|nr:hypothetical protein [Candidatus Methanoperedens nitroreducens]KCZ73365.1 hypothetical protein ANME2D_00431 [Candidatus Methanoperedens nitroreducens]MDJ1422686.1 hypothetical protein [Candidatus Methanoperedens sp.]